MDRDLERRLEALEARAGKNPQPVAIIIVRPGEDNQTAIARYYAERGETLPEADTPCKHILITREDSEPCDADR